MKEISQTTEEITSDAIISQRMQQFRMTTDWNTLEKLKKNGINISLV